MPYGCRKRHHWVKSRAAAQSAPGRPRLKATQAPLSESAGSNRANSPLSGVYVQRQPDGSWSIDHVGESVDFWCGAEEGHYMEDAGPGNSVARVVEAALGLGAGFRAAIVRSAGDAPGPPKN